MDVAFYTKKLIFGKSLVYKSWIYCLWFQTLYQMDGSKKPILTIAWHITNSSYVWVVARKK